jgi:hypothetical protein
MRVMVSMVARNDRILGKWDFVTALLLDLTNLALIDRGRLSQMPAGINNKV